MRYVSNTFSFLIAVKGTLCYGVKGITAFIHITRKAPEIVQVTLNSYAIGDGYCRQNW
jgi:hypothetical protein